MSRLRVCMECHKLSKKNGGWNAHEPCVMGGCAGVKWGRLEREEEWD